MLTVREALRLSVFRGAQVVAGAAGLDQEIRSVHIVDIPEARFEWGRPGVLLLTSGYGLKDHPDRQADLIPRLSEKGLVGLVLSTGHYFDHAPSSIVAAAERYAFPVIEVPPDLQFIHVTEAIFQRILNQQYALQREAAQIHRRLTDLVLRGADLRGLAEALASILHRSVLIEDTKFRVLAQATVGPVDFARRRSVALGRTDPDLAEYLIRSGVYDRLMHKLGPIRVPPIPDFDMTMERIVAPIIVDRVIHGYVWILSAGKLLTDLDELAIDHAATVAAVILFKEQAVRNAELALRSDFFARLLSSVPDDTWQQEMAQQIGFRTDRAHQVLVLRSAGNTLAEARELLQQVEHWLRPRHQVALPVVRDVQVVILLESSTVEYGKRFAEELVRSLGEVLIGVGGVATDRASLRSSYEQAREAVRIGRSLKRESGVISFSELGILHWLYHLPAEFRGGNAYLQDVLRLARYDAQHQTELLRSLEVYLDHGGALAEAAEVLHVHRNTLAYRLGRVEDLIGQKLQDPMTRLNLHVALKSYHLYPHEGNMMA